MTPPADRPAETHRSAEAGRKSTPDGPRVDQIVYLSNRPDVLAETFDYLRYFMPWIRQAVVLTPRAAGERVRALAGESDCPELVLVDEDDVIAASEVPQSHSARNAALRRALYARGPVADVFLQSDDDYRPMRPVPPSDFVADDRLVSYACHDLALWRWDNTTYDAVQHASYLALSYLGAGHYNFASHMPQAIDRALFGEAFAAATALEPSGAFCEWSLPLNHGRLIAPERFGPVRTFRTMCWPRYPHEWSYWRRPENVAFENFHPELYQPGGLFAGLATSLDPQAPQQQAFAKLARWYSFDLRAGRLRFPAEVNDPWRHGHRAGSTLARRGFFTAARSLRRLWEYVAQEERDQLLQLAGSRERRADGAHRFDDHPGGHGAGS